MSDDDFEDKDLKKFLDDPDDNIRPIDHDSRTQDDDVPAEIFEDFTGENEQSDEGGSQDDRDSHIQKSESVNLTLKEPTLARVMVGVGWDQQAVEEKMIDADISLFLLNTQDQTRMDEDFIFYNNPEACEGAIRHMGDNRTGAGEGDDETIEIDLNGVPYDVNTVMFVLSVYDHHHPEHTFAMIKNVFIRLTNKDDDRELVRFRIDDEDLEEGKAMYIASLEREGPQWHFNALGKLAEGGLAQVATQYGMIIKEMQSSGT